MFTCFSACIVYEKGTNISRGFGYVTFHNEKDAEEAIKGVDGMVCLVFIVEIEKVSGFEFFCKSVS